MYQVSCYIYTRYITCILMIRMGLSAPVRIGHILNLLIAVRPNELRNVRYEVHVKDLLGYLM